jgi:hypothetical protein
MNPMTTMQPVDAAELATIEGGGLTVTGVTCAGLRPDGTGKGIVIITQCEIGSPIRHAGR